MQELKNYIKEKKAAIELLKSECQLKHGYYPQEQERLRENMEVVRQWSRLLQSEAKRSDRLARLESRAESDSQMCRDWLVSHLEGYGTVKYYAQEKMGELKTEIKELREKLSASR
tara:strand:+ start:189 stop:533 length:345 start_codon:yes stop_codon:yes gene_type:complete